MKISLPKLTALAFLMGCASASSQTLNWGSFAESEIRDSEGETLDDSFLFELGTFEEDFIPDQTNVDQWLQNWRVLDTAQLGPVNEFGETQFTQATFVSTEDTRYVNMFQGLKAYIWVRNTANTEYFLTSSTEWSFPTAEVCCSTEVKSWSIGSTDVPIWGADEGGHYGGGYSVDGGYEIQTHTVPEAGASLLTLLAGGMAVLRRRRTLSR